MINVHTYARKSPLNATVLFGRQSNQSQFNTNRRCVHFFFVHALKYSSQTWKIPESIFLGKLQRMSHTQQQILIFHPPSLSRERKMFTRLYCFFSAGTECSTFCCKISSLISFTLTRHPRLESAALNITQYATTTIV